MTNANDNTGFDARKLLMTDAAIVKVVNVIIPLNRYSFFEELNNQMLVPRQLQLNVELQNDGELIYKLVALAEGRVVVNRFLLWVPKLIPKDMLYDKFVTSFLTKKSWTYNRDMYEVSAPTHSSGFFQISSSIDNVKTIFIYLQRNKTNNHDANPYIFDTFKLDSAGHDAANLRTLTTADWNMEMEYCTQKLNTIQKQK